MRRSVRAEDPTDLASPLHNAVEVLPEDPDDLEGRPPPLKPSRRWVLAALWAGGAMQTVAQLGDPTAADGHQLKARTIQEALNDLEAAGLAQDTNPGVELARSWSPTDPPARPGRVATEATREPCQPTSRGTARTLRDRAPAGSAAPLLEGPRAHREPRAPLPL